MFLTKSMRTEWRGGVQREQSSVGGFSKRTKDRDIRPRTRNSVVKVGAPRLKCKKTFKRKENDTDGEGVENGRVKGREGD